MFAGATALGYLGGELLRGGNGREARRIGISESMARTVKAHTATSCNGALERDDAGASVATYASDDATFSAAAKPNWLSHLGDTFQAEISQLKGLAVGTLLGMVRDIVAKAVPVPMERQVEELVNGITAKLGGQPLDGRILPERSKFEGLSTNGNQEDRGHHEETESSEFSPGVLTSV
jgi:hypothetical protein